MVDFSSLLSKPLDDVKRPPALPPGTYTGVIAEHKLDESREKKTPYIAFTIKGFQPGEDIDPADVTEIDFSKRTMTTNFYLTPDAEYRLKEFIESLGIATAGRSFGETIPETTGLPVVMNVVQRPDRDPDAPPRNEIQKIWGQKD
jgi:hypothetical protein